MKLLLIEFYKFIDIISFLNKSTGNELRLQIVYIQGLIVLQ